MTPNTQDVQRRQQAVADFLGSKCASVKCPMCGKSAWHDRRLSVLIEVTDDPYPFTGDGQILSALPYNVKAKDMVLPVQCECGYLMLFSAVVIGAEPRAS